MTPEERKEKRLANLNLFKKGQSGNPKGRPKGTGRVQKAIKAEIEKAAQLQLAVDAKKLLNQNSGAITLEVMQIAMRQEDKPSQAKVKCLLACFERIVPALKVVEVKDGSEVRKAADMTDAEIMDLMGRMVHMAQEGIGQLPPGGNLDG